MRRRGLTVVAGPCVAETEQLCLQVAEHLRETCDELGLRYVFKASFDKANRTSVLSPRGPGLREGIVSLAAVRSRGIAVTTDVHDASQVGAVADVVDVIQVPAFLSRQTDLLNAVGGSGRTVNIKKGQFMSPWDAVDAVEKVTHAGAREVWITERGVSFGYNQLVVDFRVFPILNKITDVPVLFDASHSTALAFAKGDIECADFIEPLAAASVVVGAAGVFFETHPQPKDAISDGRFALPLSRARVLLRRLASLVDHLGVDQ